MSKRFLMRREYFGGLIYDRRTRVEALLEPWQYDLTKSICGKSIRGSIESRRDKAFLEQLSGTGIVEDGRLDLDVVEVAVIRQGVVSAPLRLYYHITYGCNLDCAHCMFRNKKMDPNELTTAEALDLVRQADEIGCPELRITGGEPTLRRDLFRIIRAGADRGMNVVVNTNGVFGSDTCDAFIQSGVDGLVVSVDGDRETHDRLRGSGRFDATMETIHHIAEHNRAAAHKITVCLNPTISRDNAHLAEFLVRKALELGGARLGVEINFMPLRPFGKATEMLSRMLDARGWMEFDMEIARLRRLPEVVEDGLRLISQNMDLLGACIDHRHRPVPFDRSSCGATTFRMGLGPNGGGNICGFIGAEDTFRTPTLREASLLEIWHSEPFEKFRHVVKVPCEPCRFYRRQCVGICKAMSYALTGSLGEKDQYCFVDLLPDA